MAKRSRGAVEWHPLLIELCSSASGSHIIVARLMPEYPDRRACVQPQASRLPTLPYAACGRREGPALPDDKRARRFDVVRRTPS
jgi:hypothetical protein